MARRRQIRAGLDAAVEALRNPQLRRLEISWSFSITADLASTVALAVFAYDAGGTTAVGLAAAIRLLPSALAAPFMALPGDRFARERVLSVVEGVRGALVVAAAIGAWLHAPVAVYLAMALAAVISSAVRSTQFALTPALSTDPEEMIAANVGLATIEGLGTLVGPAVGGAMLAIWGAPVVLVVSGGGFLVAALVLSGIHAVVHYERIPRRGTVAREVVEGFRAIARARDARTIVVLFFAQTLIRGAVGIVIVVGALNVFGLGPGGVGLLSAAIGAGSLVGAVGTLALVGRPHLAWPFGLGLMLWGLPLIAIGLAPVAALAILAMVVVGVGNSLVDVAGMTILQRVVPDAVLARVLGALDGLVLAGTGIGAAAASVLVDHFGLRTTSLVAGGAFCALVVTVQPVLRRIDAATVIQTRPLALLRRIPMFAMLDIPTVDHLARRLTEAFYDVGDIVIREGEPGDRFYVIESGNVEITKDDRFVTALGPGHYVGEIALLRDVPRTATVTARGAVRLLALERDDFLEAMSGYALSRSEAERIAEGRLHGLRVEGGEPEDVR